MINRYFRTTTGDFAQGIVAGSVAYTDAADLEALLGKTDGSIGFFTPEGELISAPMDAGTRFVIAQKRGTQLYVSNPFTFGETNILRTAHEAAVKQVVPFTVVLGTGDAAPKAGDRFDIKIIETTPGHNPFPSWEYEYIFKAGDTASKVAAGLAANINSKTNPMNQTHGTIVVATVSGATVTLTAYDFGAHFNVIYRENTEAWTKGAITKFKQGAGTALEVGIFEEEVRRNNGANTDFMDAGLGADFPYPVQFVNPAIGYHTYRFTERKTEASKTPHNVHFKDYKFFLYVPSTGTSPETGIQAILNPPAGGE